MLKRGITLVVLGCLLLSATVAFAAYEDYDATLPRLKGDVTLLQGSKSTGDDYILHRNIDLGGDYDAVDVWIERRGSDNSWSRLSENYACYASGGPYTIYSNADLLSGNTIRARGQNHDLTTVAVNITGEIDLR